MPNHRPPTTRSVAPIAAPDHHHPSWQRATRSALLMPASVPSAQAHRRSLADGGRGEGSARGCCELVLPHLCQEIGVVFVATCSVVQLDGHIDRACRHKRGPGGRARVRHNTDEADGSGPCSAGGGGGHDGTSTGAVRQGQQKGTSNETRASESSQWATQLAGLEYVRPAHVRPLRLHSPHRACHHAHSSPAIAMSHVNTCTLAHPLAHPPTWHVPLSKLLWRAAVEGWRGGAAGAGSGHVQARQATAGGGRQQQSSLPASCAYRTSTRVCPLSTSCLASAGCTLGGPSLILCRSPFLPASSAFNRLFARSGSASVFVVFVGTAG